MKSDIRNLSEFSGRFSHKIDDAIWPISLSYKNDHLDKNEMSLMKIKTWNNSVVAPERFQPETLFYHHSNVISFNIKSLDELNERHSCSHTKDSTVRLIHKMIIDFSKKFKGYNLKIKNPVTNHDYNYDQIWIAIEYSFSIKLVKGGYYDKWRSNHIFDLRSKRLKNTLNDMFERKVELKKNKIFENSDLKTKRNLLKAQEKSLSDKIERLILEEGDSEKVIELSKSVDDTRRLLFELENETEGHVRVAISNWYHSRLDSINNVWRSL